MTIKLNKNAFKIMILFPASYTNSLNKHKNMLKIVSSIKQPPILKIINLKFLLDPLMI